MTATTHFAALPLTEYIFIILLMLKKILYFLPHISIIKITYGTILRSCWIIYPLLLRPMVERCDNSCEGCSKDCKVFNSPAYAS